MTEKPAISLATSRAPFCMLRNWKLPFCSFWGWLLPFLEVACSCCSLVGCLSLLSSMSTSISADLNGAAAGCLEDSPVDFSAPGVVPVLFDLVPSSSSGDLKRFPFRCSRKPEHSSFCSGTGVEALPCSVALTCRTLLSSLKVNS